MNYQDRIVCLIDILGFSERIREAVRDGSEDEQKISAVTDALLRFRAMFDVAKPAERPGTVVTQFSDSVVISFDAQTESGVFYAIYDILQAQIDLVSHGFLCRGAITRGKLIHTDELLLGPAFLDAYDLERKAALYPRVILDESIIQAGVAAPASHHSPDYERRSIESLVAKDGDGIYYIDYITKASSGLDDPPVGLPSYLNALTSIVKAGQDNGCLHVALKHMWILERLRPYVREVKEDAKQTFTDSDMRDAYAAIPDV